MKLLFLLLTTVWVSNCSGQPRISDTTFLYRDIKDVYHAIFINPQNDKNIYNQIRSSIQIDTNVYLKAISDLKDSGFHLLRTKPTLPSNWYSLYLYKKNYYVYMPSEPFVNTWININDSTLVMNYFNDGCLPLFMDNEKKVSKKTWQLKLKGIYPEDNSILVHLIDAKKGIAIFEFPLRQGKRKYQLMVETSKMECFPVIVNYSPSQRQDEFDFDDINFALLIKELKNQ